MDKVPAEFVIKQLMTKINELTYENAVLASRLEVIMEHKENGGNRNADES